MIKLIMSGCNGKMGRVITRLVSENEEFKIVAGFDIVDTVSNDYPVYKNPNDSTEKADVIIDFSHPNSLEKLLPFAVSRKLPIVVATTGLSHQQISKLRETASNIPVFFSANMSLGVNLLIDLVSRAAKLLEDSFDIEIIEKHHNQKIDAPSGTALAIADAISSSLTQTRDYVYDRHSVRKKRGKNEIGIHAVRGGTIVGEHSVIFAGNDEIIEINHSAMSKEIFAVGALKAAKFLIGKKPGMYNMKDLVNIL
ncbi:MAG: 4-hydroxy-tetrahydrodipicolinate reductase [Clostridia bacterium]|jgi:4-hydroxy-tetrahydrodipicolinate reductase|nr:4-hydroxy-tetrahydrodipicolinate reductase [Clostridia bacterium]